MEREKKIERKLKEKEGRETEKMIFPTTNTTTSAPRAVTESSTSGQGTSGQGTSGEGTSGQLGGSDFGHESGDQRMMKPSTPAMMIQQRISSSGSGVAIGSSTGQRSSCPSSINHSLSSSPITTSGLATSGHLPIVGSLGDHHGSKLPGILSTSPSHNYNTTPSRSEIGHHVCHDGHDDQCMVSPVDDSNYLNDNIDPVSILEYISCARSEFFLLPFCIFLSFRLSLFFLFHSFFVLFQFLQSVNFSPSSHFLACHQINLVNLISLILSLSLSLDFLSIFSPSSLRFFSLSLFLLFFPFSI